MTTDEKNDRRIEREEAFMHGVGLTALIGTIALALVVITHIPWQANAFVAAFLVIPLANLARTMWRQRQA